MCVILLNNKHQFQECVKNVMITHGKLSPVYIHDPSTNPERIIIFMKSSVKVIVTCEKESFYHILMVQINAVKCSILATVPVNVNNNSAIICL
jgi:hypothetical protein